MTDHENADEPTVRARRAHLERLAVGALGIGAVSLALVCSAVIVSGWFAGVMQDRFERFFWAGAICGFLMVVAFAVAAFPGGRDDARAIRRITRFTRVGIVLLIAAPALCIGSLVADFYL
jgi:hypothetical protein